MSDPDLRDPRLDRAYRELPGDEPPPEADERIRAAARRAVGSRPQSRGQRSWAARWRVPLSLAATVVLAVTVTLMVREEEERVLREPPAPASAPAATPPALEDRAPAPAEAAKRRDAEQPRGVTPAAPARTAPAPVEAQRSPAADSAPPASQLQNLERRQQRLEEPAAVAAPPASATPAPAAKPSEAQPSSGALGTPGAGADSLSRERAAGARPAREFRSAPQAVRSPEDWLEEIRRLKAQGRDAAATAELAEFRRRHPDYPLPADLAR